MSLHLISEADARIRLIADGVELLVYEYRPDTAALESPKPYLHPLRTRGGHVVSLFRPHDHVWHKGIAWSLPNVGEENFWGGPTYVHGEGYVQLPNNGRAEHMEFTEQSADEHGARIAHRLNWTAQDGRPIIQEERELRVELVKDAWVLVVTTAMTNVSGSPLAFGSPTTKGRENAGYGGLFWRGPRSFSEGVIRTPEGDGGEELRGSRHEWMGYTGRHDEIDASSTLVMVDDRDNPRHPPQWFARSELFACLCPAPFFSEELELAAGATLTFRYAVAIADGHEHPEGARELADRAREALIARREVREAASS